MSAIDKVKAHWDSISGVQSLDVPEWQMTVYFSPLTMQEAQRLVKVNDREGPLAAGVDTLIMKCLDAQGERLFTIADKPIFMRKADRRVIERIVNAISGESDAETIAGN